MIMDESTPPQPIENAFRIDTIKVDVVWVIIIISRILDILHRNAPTFHRHYYSTQTTEYIQMATNKNKDSQGNQSNGSRRNSQAQGRQPLTGEIDPHAD